MNVDEATASDLNATCRERKRSGCNEECYGIGWCDAVWEVVNCRHVGASRKHEEKYESWTL